MSPAETATRGRPRDADRTAAILDAAVDVMHDIGWDGFTMQEVANRAGAGLATIYRRFDTKEDLVAAAMRHDMIGTLPDQASADPRAELVTALTRLGDKMCGKGGSIISVLAAARDHETMSCAVDEVMHQGMRNAVTGLVDAIIGPDHPMTTTIADSILGTLVFRYGMLEQDIAGADFAAEMLALVDAAGR